MNNQVFCDDGYNHDSENVGQKNPTEAPRANILGVGVSSIDVSAAVSTIEQWILRREHHYVCITSVHGVIESQYDERLRSIHNKAGMVTPDGMPLVWVSHLMGFKATDRVYGPELMLAVCERSEQRGFSHFFYGGGPGVPERLIERLRATYPLLRVAGSYSPPFRPLTPDEDKEVVDQINGSGADIVWVGLSTPKQEHWMDAHVGKLNAPVLVGVGAAFDFNAGLKKQAPKWMRRSGLEWTFRLATEPRRLWSRYLKCNPIFVALVGMQLLRLRSYPLVSLAQKGG
jgi:N-acetylglucosaminyldiphosphoundecaprenol N-acetyl-beta-D-mannosaminyltransferase